MNKPRFSIFDAIENTAFGRLKLRTKLTLGNMLITFLVIFVMGSYVYFRTQQAGAQLTIQLDQNIRNRAEENLLSTSKEQAALLNNFFESMSRDTSIVGSTIGDMFAQRETLDNGLYWNAATSLVRLSSGNWDNSDSEIASIFLPADLDLSESLVAKLNILKHTELVIPSILEDNSDIIAIYFGGVTRETVYYPNIDLAAIVPPDFDVTGRIWFVEAAPENNPEQQVIWSAPYQDAALNGLVITTSVPVMDNRNRFQGVAAMDIQLLQITTLVSNIQVGETGYAFLVDNNNRLIAFPERGYSDFGITDATARLGEIMDSSTLPDAAPEFFKILDTVAADTEGVFTINLGGTEHFVAHREIPEVQYNLVIVAPSRELLTEADILSSQIAVETRNTIVVSVILIVLIFALASAISFTISSRLTTPLRDLTHAANEIISGDFEARVEVRSQDEIGTLAKTLNAMTANLKGLIQSLEQRVVERTSALQNELQKGKRRSKQYEAIAKVAQAINATQNLQELLPQISEVISQQFGYYHAGIFLNDASNQYAVLSAANSEGGKQMLKRGHQLKIGEQGIVGYATGSGKPRIALDVGEDVVYFNNPDLPETHSEMALPLIISGEIIGALDVQSTEANAFSHEDIDVLATLADQVSLAIQNARLYDQMQRSLAEAEAISRQYFREAWSQLTHDQKVTGFRYTAGGTIPLDVNHKQDQKGDSERKKVSVPIVIRGENVGALEVMVPAQERVKPDQMDLIRAVADRVAIFAENARLFDQTTRRAERERLVAEITTKIRGTNDPGEMIQIAVEELREALDVSHIEIVPQKSAPTDR
ncbi:MAG: HAMP domain-containing protein [Anaerolineaceae bacterium]|jgi:GAF domain-containing protein/HAMP domain-containing protein|nr:MAG: HAMP domain-containing protein [Anaerolineaceae bacterium]